MRKVLFVVAIALVVVMGAFAAASGEPEDGAPVVGVVNKALVGDPFQVIMNEGFETRAKELGLEILSQTASGHGRADEQVAIMEDYISRGVDAIVLIPADANALVPAVRKANEAGIPVINLDSVVAQGTLVTYIGTDNEQGAYLAGDALLQALRDRGLSSGKVAMIEGEPGHSTAIQRTDGFHRRLEEEANYEVVASLTGHWTTAGATEVMEDLIQAHPDLVGVFTASDMMGLGAAQVIGRADLTDRISLVTFDGLPEGLALVEEGRSYADVAQFPKMMGRRGAEILAEILIEGADPNSYPDFIDSGVAVVTAERVDEFMAENWE